jgi:hypothetical protein
VELTRTLRRTFLAGLGAALAWPLGAQQKRADAMPEIFQEDNWQHIVDFGGAIAVHFNSEQPCGFALSVPIVGPTSYILSSFFYRNPLSGFNSWLLSGVIGLFGDGSPNRSTYSAGGFGLDGAPGFTALRQVIPDMTHSDLYVLDGFITPPVDTNWHHIIALMDTSAQTVAITLDKVPKSLDFFDSLHFNQDGFVGSPSPPFLISTTNEYQGALDFSCGMPFDAPIFGTPPGTELAELWWSFIPALVDLADPAFLRKWINDDGSPANLGANGEVPMGFSPLIFGHGGKDTFLQPNLGTGGAFTLTGQVIDGQMPVHVILPP